MSSLTPEEIQHEEMHIGDNRDGQMIAANVICLVVAYTFVMARFVSRSMIKARCGWDDWLILSATVREVLLPNQIDR